MKTKLFFLLFSYLSLNQLFAQQSIVSSGNDGSSSSGKVSFTVGQVAFSSATNISGNTNEGVQQPFEIVELATHFENQLSFNVLLFPNPASTSVTLSIGTENTESDLKYLLTDINGRIISSEQIHATETNINVSGLPEACYFVNIMTSGKIVKTFKLLKNK